MLLILCLFLVLDLTFAGLPGPLVYVVTPAPKHGNTEVPYYYSNWRRNMDIGPQEEITTTVKPKSVQSPDLIFAEFEADDDSRMNAMKKTLRQLLEREKLRTSTTAITTAAPILSSSPTFIHVAEPSDNGDSEEDANNPVETYSSILSYPAYNYPIHENKEDIKESHSIKHETYENQNDFPDNVNTTTETETSAPPMKVEDIWHIIDNEKVHDDQLKWQEVYNAHSDNSQANEHSILEQPEETYAYPGFIPTSTDNESRAIRTDSKLRFPYVNLKTYQMKNNKKPIYGKNKNGMVSLGEIEKEQVIQKGVALEHGYPVQKQPAQIERYNPAQPYLAPYGPNKFSAENTPMKTISNLIPPPRPPPPPKVTDTLPPPSSYDSFPPYTPNQPPPPKVNDVLPPPSSYESYPPYPPSRPESGKPPKPSFTPTAPPPVPAVDSELPSYALSDGYQYSPPFAAPPNEYNPPPTEDEPTPPKAASAPQDMSAGYDYKPPLKASADNGNLNNKPGYSYSKPQIPFELPPSKPAYPEMVYSKPLYHSHPPEHDHVKQHDMPDTLSPPPMGDTKPDFPSMTYDHDTFPSLDGVKLSDDHHHHDFGDYDHYHHHHHHTTTTTTTTEMPRVNRYSYYYLGKKLYYLPLYFSVYFVIYVSSLIIKSFLRHKITYPNSFINPATRVQRSVAEDWNMSSKNMHEITRRVTNGIVKAAAKYMKKE